MPARLQAHQDPQPAPVVERRSKPRGLLHRRDSGEPRPRRRRPGLATIAALARAGAACDSILGPTTPDANWNVRDTTRFTFHVRPGSFAEQNVSTLGAVLEDQYDVTLSTLGLQYSGRIYTFLYDSASDGDLPSDHSGVAYPATATLRAVCVPPLDGNLFGLLSHEANHVILRNGLGRPGTSFVNEGLASAVLSERFGAFGPSFLYAWTRINADAIPPLAELADDDKWSGFPQDVAYNASASLLAYLIETSGPDRLRQLYYARSDAFAPRFQEIYGRSLETAEAEWKAFCASR